MYLWNVFMTVNHRVLDFVTFTLILMYTHRSYLISVIGLPCFSMVSGFQEKLLISMKYYRWNVWKKVRVINWAGRWEMTLISTNMKKFCVNYNHPYLSTWGHLLFHLQTFQPFTPSYNGFYKLYHGDLTLNKISLKSEIYVSKTK